MVLFVLYTKKKATETAWICLNVYFNLNVEDVYQKVSRWRKTI